MKKKYSFNFFYLLFALSLMTIACGNSDTKAKKALVGDPNSYFSIGGSVSGLDAGSFFKITNNNGDETYVFSSGSFTLPTTIKNGTGYSIAISLQPGIQTCNVSNGSGSVNGANITNISITCTGGLNPTYAIGGTVSGLNGGNSFKIKNNGIDQTTISANGTFNMTTSVSSASTYNITVSVQAGGGQICSVTNPSGTVASANITNISISCTGTLYTIGGNASGLNGGNSFKIKNNAIDQTTISANGTFTMTTSVSNASTYNITISVQAGGGQICSVTNPSGTVTSANITNVNISCNGTTYTLGGTISNLAGGNSLKIVNNGGDILTISSNATYTFATALTASSTFNISIDTQPADQTCYLTNANGVMPASSTSSISISCNAKSLAYNASCLLTNSFVTLPAASTAPTSGVAFSHTITLDGTNDFVAANEKFTAGDGKFIYISWDATNIYIGYDSENLVTANKAIYFAFNTGNTNLSAGGLKIPYGQWFEGSSTNLPFHANYLFYMKYVTTAEQYKVTWNGAKAVFNTRVSASSTEMTSSVAATYSEFKIARAAIGNPTTIDLVVYAKNLTNNTGWGWLFGSNDANVVGGTGDKVISQYYSFDLSSPDKPTSYPIKNRLNKYNKTKIYQLLVRTFSNQNKTRAKNGSLNVNGTGKFNDINNAALTSLKDMGFSHIWLTGVLQQATATDYTGAGQAADDPDLLKGIAGSPYAIKDYYDVSPDYAVTPSNRLVEFQNLINRIHTNNLKVIIDLVPNHVARSYNSDIMPAQNFGASDTTSSFFLANNNFFYINGALTLPTTNSPTCLVLGTCNQAYAPEATITKVTGNDVNSTSPSASTWYETIKLNYGFNFTNLDGLGAPNAGAVLYPTVTNSTPAIPDTWLKMDKIIEYWQNKGVDGFRSDMSHMVPPEFWTWAIARARARNAQVYFTGEAYNGDNAKVVPDASNALEPLLLAGFNSVYDDPIYDNVKRIYDSTKWANDLDNSAVYPGMTNLALGSTYFRDNALHYAENHDEVRLGSKANWKFGGSNVGMESGKPVSALIFGLSKGPVLIYNGQEVGESADGIEGFGGDDGRTSIFDYWSLSALQKWVNSLAYDGAILSARQSDLRRFYKKLLRLVSQRAFANGDFFALNSVNKTNTNFGGSGQYMYAYLRYDKISQEKYLVVVNLHAQTTYSLNLKISQAALNFLGITNGTAGPDAVNVQFSEMLSRTSCATSLVSNVTVGNLYATGLPIASIAPLTAYYYKIQ